MQATQHGCAYVGAVYLLRSRVVSGAVRSLGSSGALRAGTGGKGLSTAPDKLGKESRGKKTKG